MFGLRSVRKSRNRVETSEPAGFSMGELSRLRDQGMLTEEEFAKARDSILARGGKEMMMPVASARPPAPSSPRGFEVLPKKAEPRVPEKPPSNPPAET